MAMPDRLKGVAITTLGVVILSPDALLIMLIGTDLWTMVFWRNLLVALSLCAYLVYDRGRRTLKAYTGLGSYGCLGAACFAFSGVFFVAAIGHTSVANTMVILGTAPLFAAVLSLVLLRERVERCTWLAIASCLVGIGVIFSGSLKTGGLLGALAAMGAAACMAGVFVSVRAAPRADNRAMLSLGGFASAGAILMFGSLATVTGDAWLYLLLLGGVVVPVSLTLITVGPRYITAAEVSLIMLLEMVLAPFLVWLVLGLAPSLATVAGAIVILVTLAVYYAGALGRLSSTAAETA